jgi:hypothetical protein
MAHEFHRLLPALVFEQNDGDQIGGSGAPVLIEARGDVGNLTDCIWRMYTGANDAQSLGIELKRITEPTETDSKIFINNGNCTTQKFCKPIDCQLVHCSCDSYHRVDFEKLASVSVLFRQTLMELVTHTDESCP